MLVDIVVQASMQAAKSLIGWVGAQLSTNASRVGCVQVTWHGVGLRPAPHYDDGPRLH